MMAKRILLLAALALTLAAITAITTLWIADQRFAPIDRASTTSTGTTTLLADDRPTTTLGERSIQPVISTNGTVHAKGDGFVLRAPISPDDLTYRLVTTPPYGIKALISGGPAGFDCAWSGLVPGDTGGMAVECTIPKDVTVVEGLSGTMAITFTAPTKGQALPLTAVFGSAQQGSVVVVHADGHHELRSVTLGISDTRWIQVTSGLEPTEQVLTYPVESDLVAAGS